MTDWHGNLRKMTTELADPVRYTVLPDEGGPCLNDLLGKTLSVTFTGAIHCVACDRLTKKSFNQGYCFPCFRKLAACDSCIMSPEKCHLAEGLVVSRIGQRHTVRCRILCTCRTLPASKSVSPGKHNCRQDGLIRAQHRRNPLPGCRPAISRVCWKCYARRRWVTGRLGKPC